MNIVDNLKLQFKIKSEGCSEEEILQQPIIVNDVAVGMIKEVVLDDLGLYYNCEGIIWDRFIFLEDISINKDKHTLMKISSDKDSKIKKICPLCQTY